MKCELLSPAGDLDRLNLAYLYGADAAYIGGGELSLRAPVGFDYNQLEKAVSLANSYGRKIYIACNAYPRGEDIPKVRRLAEHLSKIKPHAVILSDPGVFSIFKETGIPIHISTQANVVSSASALFWAELGASRIIMARELSLEEIRNIRNSLPSSCQLECFVHGAMCMAYSGRCLLSNYLTHRDSNRGACAQPCRWNYTLMEEKRPGVNFPIEEGAGGSFIFNSKDLCMISHIKELIDAGIESLKIEGRMKSEYYVSTVTKAYRGAIDYYYNEPSNYSTPQKYIDELHKVSHREYSTGFYFPTQQPLQIYGSSSYIRHYDIVGIVKGYEGEVAIIEQRNKFKIGDTLEIVPPVGDYIEFTVDKMMDQNGNEIRSCPHPQMIVKINLNTKFPINTILRAGKLPSEGR